MMTKIALSLIPLKRILKAFVKNYVLIDSLGNIIGTANDDIKKVKVLSALSLQFLYASYHTKVVQNKNSRQLARDKLHNNRYRYEIKIASNLCFPIHFKSICL